MRFECKGAVIERDAAIKTAIEICAKVCNGITQFDAAEIAEAFEEITPIAFLCDRRACEKCSFPTCKHTLNINHAENFKKEETVTYIEKERSKTNDTRIENNDEIF